MTKHLLSSRYIAIIGLFIAMFALPIQAQNILLSEDFEDVILDENEGESTQTLPAGWTKIDADKDGQNWFIYYTEPGGVGQGHNGGKCATSASFDKITQTGIHPDNYLVSPEVKGAVRVTFFACAQDESYSNEHFAICASTTGKEAGDFKIIQEWTISELPTSAPGKRLKDQTAWKLFDVNLPEGTKYIAFRHYNSTDQYCVNIDDVTVYGKQAITNYGFKVGDTEVTSGNALNISQVGGFSAVTKGKLTYDDASKTLTLKNATIKLPAESEASGLEFLGNQAYTIKLEGNNQILTTRGWAIRGQKGALSVKGPGKLVVIMSDSLKGIKTQGDLSFSDKCKVIGAMPIITEQAGKIYIDGAYIHARNRDSGFAISAELSGGGDLAVRKAKAYYQGREASIGTYEGKKGQTPTQFRTFLYNNKPCDEIIIQDLGPDGVIFEEDFESVTLDKEEGLFSFDMPYGWTTIDADKDSATWVTIGDGRNGGNCATSASWKNKGLTPDNFLITPELYGAMRVTFYACPQDKNVVGDHFAVCASSTGREKDDFTVVQEWTTGEEAAPAPGAHRLDQGEWKLYDVNLPAGTKYIAFRHFNTTDKFRVNIDDVKVYGDLTGVSHVSNEAPVRPGIYSLSGVKLNGNLNDLPKGIYIVNGKKLVKK